MAYNPVIGWYNDGHPNETKGTKAGVTPNKYLGVTLTSDLTWSNHIRNITTKSRRLAGLLYRQFYKWSSPATLSMQTLCFTSETPS